METTEGNIATQGTGGFDKLVDLSFSGSNQTLSTICSGPFFTLFLFVCQFLGLNNHVYYWLHFESPGYILGNLS